MDINLKEYYYDKFIYYAINNKCYRSFKKHKDSIKESINKIVDANNDNLLTESFISYITNNDLYMKLSDIATNDKYLIYELLSSYYQELIRYITCSHDTITPYIRESYITNYLDLKTKEIIMIVFLLFYDMYGIYDLNKYYAALIKQTVFFILSYCHINNCMDKFEELISEYKDDIYKIIDEIIINGLDLVDTNKELIDVISNGLMNRNKKIIK